MSAADVSRILGYDGSPQWLSGAGLRALAQRDHAVSRTMHACRRFGGELWGVYVLRSSRTETPASWLVDVPNLDAADEIHRRVWNQDVAPFLLLATPDAVRVCTGFRYDARERSDVQRGVLHAALALDGLGRALDDLRAEQMDLGTPWQRRAAELTGEHRVDVRLLRNLGALRRQLLRDQLAPSTAHALIGRFLYLRHLIDRGLLDALGIGWDLELRRTTTVRELRRLIEAIDDRLNGEVFPLPWTGAQAPLNRHVQAVASAFLGDEVTTGQLHLDFRAYDFAYVPVETLSNVYEQFLGSLDDANNEEPGDEADDAPTRREAGAFYTPIPLVNFVLDELEDARPLTASTRVLDPSCGSGAFLVQCYRRLITRWREENRGVALTAAKLRELLTSNIFGIDPNEDACRVTEFSLVLALLDHLPDAEQTLSHGFKLPTLHQRNIFVGDFFDQEGAWRTQRKEGFDWIVGNPPWVTASDKGQDHARAWIAAEENASLPVVDKRVAEAFAWEAPRHLRSDGRVAFVMPGMTLFAARPVFREQFFGTMKVEAVTNLANLREVLFDGRARLPAAVLVYGPSEPDGPAPMTCIYSPMLLHQAATMGTARKRARVWSLALNQSEVRVLRQSELAQGDALPWKIAMWGSPRDARLLQRLARRCPLTLGQWVKQRGWSAGIGPKFPDKRSGTKGYRHVPALAGMRCMDGIRTRERNTLILAHADGADLTSERTWVRRPGLVHLMTSSETRAQVAVDIAGRFARFDLTGMIVPHPHAVILGSERDAEDLRIVAVLLSSRIARYHGFFSAPQEGIKSGRLTLGTLLALPLPSAAFEGSLRTRLLALQHVDETLDALVAEAYGLRETDHWLINDLLDVKLGLVDGLTRDCAVAPPDHAILTQYAVALCDSLDAFYDAGRDAHHAVHVFEGRDYACASVTRVAGASIADVVVADGELADALARVHQRVRREHPQWIYFDRNLRVFGGDAVWIFKPLQRCEWTQSEALHDADTLIAEALAASSRS
jgi:methylase of polypeptide subunit release factors